MPHFGKAPDWLAERGLTLYEYPIEQAGDWRPEGYWLGTIDVGAHHHVVVYRGDEIVWQPDTRWSLEATIAGDFPLVYVAYLAVLDVGALRSRLLDAPRLEAVA